MELETRGWRGGACCEWASVTLEVMVRAQPELLLRSMARFIATQWWESVLMSMIHFCHTRASLVRAATRDHEMFRGCANWPYSSLATAFWRADPHLSLAVLQRAGPGFAQEAQCSWSWRWGCSRADHTTHSYLWCQWCHLSTHTAIGKVAYSVMIVEEISLSLTSYSTQESRPCTSPEHHSRAGTG